MAMLRQGASLAQIASTRMTRGTSTFGTSRPPRASPSFSMLSLWMGAMRLSMMDFFRRQAVAYKLICKIVRHMQ